VDYLARLVASPAYRRGEIDTGLIEREQNLLAPIESPSAESWALAALALIEARRAAAREYAARTADPHSPWNEAGGWRVNAPAEQQVRLRHGTTERTVRAVAATDATEPGTWTLHLDSSSILAHATPGSQGRLRATLDGHRVEATAFVSAESIDLYFDGRHQVFARGDVLPDTVIDAAATGGLVAPMPGRVTAVLAQAGASVARGTPLVVIEAMKMEHTIAAPAAGTVLAIDCAVGDQVSEGVRLVDFKAGAGHPGQ
jgi:3-methylcrotonyl-CoA carboxylase alpha subunit